MDLSDTYTRAASEADLDVILSIENRAYQPPWTRQQFLDCCNDRYRIEIVFKADDILAYWVLQPILDELHILNFCVNPDYQKQGYGSVLLRRLLDNLSNEPLSRVLLEVRRSNKAARNLYRSCGFEHMGIRKGYYPTVDTEREDAITMQLFLGE